MFFFTSNRLNCILILYFLSESPSNRKEIEQKGNAMENNCMRKGKNLKLKKERKWPKMGQKEGRKEGKYE